ncbi:NUDIX domain-containing protein [Paraburkholderia sp. 32]|uniref:NUDIX domain-containing protein n=1 Tax=Paraburkholderia sp. 32 TaxID=2991057 RepID=UPI003D1D932E
MQSIVDVNVLFLNGQGECLFIQRANTGFRDGQYALIAGHLEPGESIEACAIRESKEGSSRKSVMVFHDENVGEPIWVRVRAS